MNSGKPNMPAHRSISIIPTLFRRGWSRCFPQCDNGANRCRNLSNAHSIFLIATDLTKIEVDTNVPESDVGSLKEGNNATFTVEAFPKRTFRGVVSQVRQSPQTVQNVVAFDVVISASNQDLALMPGMTADAQIVTDGRANVIRVPTAALHYVPGGVRKMAFEPQVWILRNDLPTAIPVVVGLSDNSYTEIVSGDVKLGDQVITAEQNAASDRALALKHEGSLRG